MPDGPVDARFQVTHGTTCVAIRYADGVVMAGDRRATSGNFISHRTIEKVFPADRHSGVAIAGAAGPAVEMVRLFQLQLEHYEKVEGSPISLEGKANQLSQMVRNHLPAAMQGLAVVPIFAGYDTHRAVGRLFQYDVTGGRYEESDHADHRLGQPARHHGDQARLARLARRRRRRSTSRSGRCTRPPTRTPPPADPTWSAASTRWSPPSPQAGFERLPDEDLAARYVTLLERIASDRGGQPS